jgi:hypothetical protein
MTSVEMMEFESFLLESFGEGVYKRELRLSIEQLEYLKGKYPSAACKELSLGYADDKRWYEINLLNHSIHS